MLYEKRILGTSIGNHINNEQNKMHDDKNGGLDLARKRVSTQQELKRLQQRNIVSVEEDQENCKTDSDSDEDTGFVHLLNRTKVLSKKNDELEGELKQSQIDLKKLRDKIEELTTINSEQDVKLADYQKDIELLKREKENLDNRNENDVKEKQDLQVEIHSCKKAITELKKNTEKQKLALQKDVFIRDIKISALQKENCELQTALEESQMKQETLEVQYKNSVEDKRISIGQCTLKIGDLEGKFELERKKEKEHKFELAQKTAQIKDLQDLLAQAKGQKKKTIFGQQKSLSNSILAEISLLSDSESNDEEVDDTATYERKLAKQMKQKEIAFNAAIKNSPPNIRKCIKHNNLFEINANKNRNESNNDDSNINENNNSKNKNKSNNSRGKVDSNNDKANNNNNNSDNNSNNNNDNNNINHNHNHNNKNNNNNNNKNDNTNNDNDNTNDYDNNTMIENVENEYQHDIEERMSKLKRRISLVKRKVAHLKDPVKESLYRLQFLLCDFAEYIDNFEDLQNNTLKRSFESFFSDLVNYMFKLHKELSKTRDLDKGSLDFVFEKPRLTCFSLWSYCCTLFVGISVLLFLSLWISYFFISSVSNDIILIKPT